MSTQKSLEHLENLITNTPAIFMRNFLMDTLKGLLRDLGDSYVYLLVDKHKNVHGRTVSNSRYWKQSKYLVPTTGKYPNI